jgi:hypothetical protein
VRTMPFETRHLAPHHPCLVQRIFVERQEQSPANSAG